MKNLIFHLIRYASWIHEVFHLIPAKMLGVSATSHSDHVIFEISDQNWKNFAIILGPFIVFAGVFVRVLYMTKHGLDSGWLWPAGFLWASCVWDVVDVVQYVRNHTWE